MAKKEETQEQLRTAIEAARRGNKVVARELLRQVVNAEPRNELAWMWLASVVDSVQERRACLQRVLQINPGNSRAREALQKLGAQSEQKAAAPRREDAAEKSRRTQQQRVQTTRTRTSGGGLTITRRQRNFIAAGVLLVLIAILALSQGRTPPPPSTPDATAEVVSIAGSGTPATPGALAARVTPSNTPFTGVIVTVAPENLPTLPPTFTPTFTPTATMTFTPSATPYPPSVFSLLYSSAGPEGELADLFMAQGDGSGANALASNQQGFADLAYSPDGSAIAFVRSTGGTGPEGEPLLEIFVAPADNPAAATQLTRTGTGIVGSPSWSPDGSEIAFASNFDGDEEIWIMDASGANARQITNNDGIDREPAWSPDGSRIVYASDQDSTGQPEIYSITPTGSDIVALTGDTGSSFSPTWSPDGTRIAFISNRGVDNDVYIMDSDGQRPFLLTVDDGGADDRDAVFTPDGRWIAFSSNREGDVYQIYLVDLRGDTILRVTQTARNEGSPVFRPGSFGA